MIGGNAPGNAFAMTVQFLYSEYTGRLGKEEKNFFRFSTKNESISII
jgi:hypothetical protein